METESENNSPTETAAHHTLMRLKIDPVIQAAENIADAIQRQLPQHTGLQQVSRSVAAAATEAKTVSVSLRRPFGWHRIPATFLVLALGGMGTWVYRNYIYQSQLVVAVPARDAIALKDNLGRRIRLVTKETVGSRESIAYLKDKSADVAFIQGGVSFPDEFPRIQLDQSEVVLFYMHDHIQNLKKSKQS